MSLALLGSPRIQLAYKIFCWANFAALLLCVGLILHKSRAPGVARDRAAASRVEQKFAEAEQARAAGATALKVRMDPQELNSYLADNLGLDPVGGPSIPSTGQSTWPAASAGPGTDDAPGAEPVSVEQAESDVRDVQINLVGDLLEVDLIFNAHGEDLSLDLAGHLQTDPLSRNYSGVACCSM